MDSHRGRVGGAPDHRNDCDRRDARGQHHRRLSGSRNLLSRREMVRRRQGVGRSRAFVNSRTGAGRLTWTTNSWTRDIWNGAIHDAAAAIDIPEHGVIPGFEFSRWMQGRSDATFIVGAYKLQPRTHDLSNNTQAQAQAQAASFADLPWWQVFQDPQLQELIRTALKQNYDMQIATERINAARAQVVVTRSNLFPQVQGNGNFTGGKENTFQTKFNFLTLTADAAFQLDLFGRLRRATEQRALNCWQPRTPSEPSL